MRLALLLVICCAACMVKTGGGRTRFGLGVQRDLSQPSRDPRPDRPLGEDTAAPMADTVADADTETALGVVAALLGALAGGKLPLLQVSGTFDEVAWLRALFGR